MKTEKFGWFAERAPVLGTMPAVAGPLEFLVKSDDSSLEPEPTAEMYCEHDGGLKKLFAIEDVPERRSSTSLAYEDLTKAVFGSSDPLVMDIRSSEPIAARKPISGGTALEKRDKPAVFNGSTVEFHGRDKWTHFYRDGELVRMRLESGDFSEPLEFDGQGNAA